MRIYYDPIREIRGYLDTTTYLVGPVRGESVVIAEIDEISFDAEEEYIILKKLEDVCWQPISEYHYFYNWRLRKTADLSTYFFSEIS